MLDAQTAENAEYVALVVVELGRSLAAKGEQIVAEEGLHACEREVGEAGAVVQERVDALVSLVSVLKLLALLSQKNRR
jgi:hypothetical protein